MVCLYSYGKFQNKVLRWIAEPFLILFRLAFLGSWLYFVIWYNTLYRWFGGCYYALYDNWWHNPKTDPWITNASYFNAFLNWPLWVLGWFLMTWSALMAIGLTLNFIAFVICNYRGRRMKVLKFLLELPFMFWLFLRGLSERQYERPYNPDQKCP